MSKTIECKGWIVYDEFRKQYPASFPTPFTFTLYQPGDDSELVVVREHTFEVEVPDDFDPRPQMVKALEAQKEKARAEFAAKVVELDRRINELLAIECVEVPS